MSDEVIKTMLLKMPEEVHTKVWKENSTSNMERKDRGEPKCNMVDEVVQLVQLGLEVRAKQRLKQAKLKQK